jgi:hypothetical protein
MTFISIINLVMVMLDLLPAKCAQKESGSKLTSSRSEWCEVNEGGPGMQALATYIAVICLAVAAFPGAIVSQPGNTMPDGQVGFLAAAGNEIVSLNTKLVVPAKPQTGGTLFLWPGLQPRPDDANYWPIGNGVLQSVLTWGPSCAPGDRPKGGPSWWISGQYVNDLGNTMGYQGCQGGTIIGVSSMDTLLINISLVRSIWRQTILNLRNNDSTGFHAGLADQAQGIARFYIEAFDGAISPDVTFLETTIGFAHPHLNNCSLDERGPGDVVTKPVIVDNGLSCYIEKIVLKAPSGAQPAKAHPQFH